MDLTKLPKNLFLWCLVSYPIIAYIALKFLSMDPTNALGLITMSYFLYMLWSIYKSESKLIFPIHVVFFGLFAIYTLLSYIFISDIYSQRGYKYFYTNKLWLSFITLIIVENIQFSYKTLNFVKKALEFTLILAAIVSIIQIVNPLFLLNDDMFIQGLSVERMVDYYGDKQGGVTTAIIGQASRILEEGYRFSIFSYVDPLSVGIDAIAIYCILYAWRSSNRIKKEVTTLLSGIISILSSSRWILLNFVVVSSQRIWQSKNKLIKLIYFMFFGVLLLVVIGFTANFMGFDVEGYITERLMSDSASTRILAFDVFLQVFPDNPIFGTGGADTEKMKRLIGGRSSQIHVGYLKLFYYHGLIGGLLFLAFMVSFLIRLQKRAKYSGYWGSFYAILAFFIANLTLVELSVFYYGLLLAVIFGNHFYESKLKNNQLNQA